MNVNQFFPFKEIQGELGELAVALLWVPNQASLGIGTTLDSLTTSEQKP